ncbi:hypothetical protein FQN49_005097 [Arthroderma sp. PD_2]|nr:hypothetical protein FQN49_005097 [Arthroderma sp. PD_2]
MKFSPASLLLALTALCPLVTNAAENAPTPPKLEPFIRMELLAGYAVNSTTLFGEIGRTPNLGGNFTGEIEGKVLATGSAIERVAPTTNQTKTAVVAIIQFITNTYSLNTTSGTTLVMDVSATLHYANLSLHGLGSVSFSTDGNNELAWMNFANFALEVFADFKKGMVSWDVFEIKSATIDQ